MSFHQQLSSMAAELNQLFDSQMRKYQSFPSQLERTISTNQKKLELFIENFQNQIIALKKAEERDCKMIENLRFENERRKGQNGLIVNAMRMEENILAKIKQNVTSMQNFLRDLDSKTIKHQEQLNRHIIDQQQIESKQKSKSGGLVQLIENQKDKQIGKMVLKINKNGTKLLQINYNKNDDKFTINSLDKNVTMCVGEFNFHRNLSQLYNDLYRIL